MCRKPNPESERDGWERWGDYIERSAIGVRTLGRGTSPGLRRPHSVGRYAENARASASSLDQDR